MNIPRRAYIEKRTELETEIWELIGKVEGLGASPLLTSVVVYLDKAFNTLADWEDCQHENKTYNNNLLLLSHPPKRTWVCDDCGREGHE